MITRSEFTVTVSHLLFPKKYGSKTAISHHTVTLEKYNSFSWKFTGDQHLVFCLLTHSDTWKVSFAGMNKMFSISDSFLSKLSLAIQDSARTSLSLFKRCWAIWILYGWNLTSFSIRSKYFPSAPKMRDCWRVECHWLQWKASLTLCRSLGVRTGRGGQCFMFNTLPVSLNLLTHASIVFRDGTWWCCSTLTRRVTARCT